MAETRAMAAEPRAPRVAHRIELSAAEADLVRTALHMLLQVEDDPETIRDLKRLLARLEPER